MYIVWRYSVTSGHVNLTYTPRWSCDFPLALVRSSSSCTTCVCELILKRIKSMWNLWILLRTQRKRPTALPSHTRVYQEHFCLLSDEWKDCYLLVKLVVLMLNSPSDQVTVNHFFLIVSVTTINAFAWYFGSSVIDWKSFLGGTFTNKHSMTLKGGVCILNYSRAVLQIVPCILAFSSSRLACERRPISDCRLTPETSDSRK